MTSNIDINNEGLHQELVREFGYAIRDLFSARLGFQDATGTQFLKVLSTDTDLPNQYYFHHPSSAAEFVGTAFNTGQVPVADKFLIYDMPVRVRQVGKAVFELAGLDGILAAEFIADVNLTPPDNPTRLENFLPGLLDQTEPASLKYRIMAAAYRHYETHKYAVTITASGDITSLTDVLGATITLPSAGLAKYVLVQWDFVSNSESRKQGDTFDQTLVHISANTLDQNDSSVTLFPEPDSDKFRCGYIRLQNDTTSLARGTNFWAQQEVITLADTTGPQTITWHHIIPNGRQTVWFGHIDVSGGILEVNGRLEVLP